MVYSDTFGIIDSSFKVKITYPHKNDTIAIKDKVTVEGISNYTPDMNCSVSLIINNKKPYSVVNPKGNNGSNDFTKWNFVIDNNDKKNNLDNGINKITAKNYCLKSKSSVFNSIFFNMSSQSGILPNANDVEPTKKTHSDVITPSNAVCCKNYVNNGEEKSILPNTTIKKIGSDNSNSTSPSMSKKSNQNLSEKIQLNIEKLFTDNSNNLNSDSNSDSNDDESGSNTNRNSNDLSEIKSTIDRALD
jgi:hypothetical protein